MGNREIKEAKVLEIMDKLKRSEAAVLSSYIGITVEEDTALRKKMREVGVEYKVIKNSFTSRAAKEVGYEGLEEYLIGPVAVSFSYDDPTKPARVLAEFAKTNKKIQLKAGIVQGKLFDTVKMNELSTIPPKDVLIGKLLGSFKAPVSNFVYMLNALSEKKQANA